MVKDLMHSKVFINDKNVTFIAYTKISIQVMGSFVEMKANKCLWVWRPSDWFSSFCF